MTDSQMKKALLFLMVLVLRVDGMEQEGYGYDYYGQDQNQLVYPNMQAQYMQVQYPIEQPSFAWDQAGNPFVYDPCSGWYVPCYYTVADCGDQSYQNQYENSEAPKYDMFSQNPLLDWNGSQEDVALPQHEQEDDAPQDLRYIFEELATVAGHHREEEMIYILNHMDNRVRDIIQWDGHSNKRSFRGKNEQREKLLALFQETGAFDFVVKFIQSDLENKDTPAYRIIGRFGALMTRMSPNGSKEFDFGYDCLRYALEDSGKLPVCERVEFGNSVAFCDKIFDGIRSKSKQQRFPLDAFVTKSSHSHQRVQPRKLNQEKCSPQILSPSPRREGMLASEGCTAQSIERSNSDSSSR